MEPHIPKSYRPLLRALDRNRSYLVNVGEGVPVSLSETAGFELEGLLRTCSELSSSERKRFISWVLAEHGVSSKGLAKQGSSVLKRTTVLLLCSFTGSQVRAILALETLRRLQQEFPDLPTAVAALRAEIAKAACGSDRYLSLRSPITGGRADRTSRYPGAAWRQRQAATQTEDLHRFASAQARGGFIAGNHTTVAVRAV